MNIALILFFEIFNNNNCRSSTLDRENKTLYTQVLCLSVVIASISVKTWENQHGKKTQERVRKECNARTTSNKQTQCDARTTSNKHHRLRFQPSIHNLSNCSLARLLVKRSVTLSLVGTSLAPDALVSGLAQLKLATGLGRHILKVKTVPIQN